MKHSFTTQIVFCLFGTLSIFQANAGESQPLNSVFDQQGFYAGFGTGLNITQNSNLIKTFTQNQQLQISNMGNVDGYSAPIFLYGGYRFNPYFGIEASYTYSGNQEYVPPNNCTTCTNFWGSQNYGGLSALGYLPVNNWFYLKARIGLAAGGSTMTTYTGNPGTTNITSILGFGIDYPLTHHLALNFDYINYGLLLPIQLQYRPPENGPSLGTINTLQENLFLFSLKVHF